VEIYTYLGFVIVSLESNFVPFDEFEFLNSLKNPNIIIDLFEFSGTAVD